MDITDKALGKKPIRHLLRWIRAIIIVSAFFAAIAFADSWHTYQRTINVPGPDACMITVCLYEEGTEIESWEIREDSQKEYFLAMISRLKYGGLFLPPAGRSGAYYTVQVTEPLQKTYGAWLLLGEDGVYYDVLGTSAANPFQLRYGHSKDLFLEIDHFLSANVI